MACATAGYAFCDTHLIHKIFEQVCVFVVFNEFSLCDNYPKTLALTSALLSMHLILIFYSSSRAHKKFHIAYFCFILTQ